MSIVTIDTEEVSLAETVVVPKGVLSWCSICRNNTADFDLYYEWEPRPDCGPLDRVRLPVCKQHAEKEQHIGHVIYHISLNVNKYGCRTI
ncbi:hypothetical protein [Ktedonospora formicarum]|uniref:Uncharacterized protein n=1 Tax=Ktedonospora formicarum TaxID=2778364 RepID=A0A8J3I1N7_9CHLR|nr:hypothetical protein [Ktedonospora formicarum]GHO45150.1 hypothetical protein KSX_33130 [Ktedonospora formicarum]